MPDAGGMRIGYDLDMLCEATTMAAKGYVISRDNIQRRMRVGYIKASTLIHLMHQYGVISWGIRHQSLITEEQLPAKPPQRWALASSTAR